MNNGGIRHVAFIDRVHPYLREQLEKRNIRCDDLSGAGRDEILQKIPLYQGIIIRSRFPVDRELLDTAADLKFIARSGAGMENIDTEYAIKKGIELFNSPEGNRTAVAEHALGMLLSLFNKLNEADRQVREGIWDREGNRGIELEGKVFAIVGYGNMGSALAERLQCFGVEVIAYDKYKAGYGNHMVKETGWNEIFERADIVSLHVPLAADTVGLMCRERIEKFEKPFYLINTARGKNVVLADLEQALDSGKIRGACLDVFEFENAAFATARAIQAQYLRLMDSKKVILSPHVAGWTVESYYKLSYFLYRKIAGRFFS